MSENEELQGLIIELRRGSLTLAVLACLCDAAYGYALLQTLQEKGVAIEANTLYPLLRRLESQGLLQSQWDTSESRPRKYYSVSEKGRRMYGRLLEEWRNMRKSIDGICKGEE